MFPSTKEGWRFVAICWMLIALLILLTGCGQETITVEIPDNYFTEPNENGWRKFKEPFTQDHILEILSEQSAELGVVWRYTLSINSVDEQNNNDLFNLILEQRWKINEIIERLNNEKD